MNTIEILTAVANITGFELDRNVYAIRVLRVIGSQYEKIFEYQLRTYLGREIDANRKLIYWTNEDLFVKCLMGLTKMLESGKLIEEVIFTLIK